MNRRQFVGGISAGLASGFAGCASSGSRESGTKYTLKLYAVTPDEFRLAFARRAGKMSAEELSVFRDARVGKRRTYGHRPIENGELVAYGGDFYRVQVAEAGQKTNERMTVRAEAVDSAEASEQAVVAGAYPGDDTDAIKDAIASARDAEQDYHVLRNYDSDDSDLLPEPKYEFVKWGDQIYRLVVGQRRVTETVYTYTTTNVADTETAFREYVREEVVTLRLPSSKFEGNQRVVLNDARGGKHSERGDLSSGFRAVLERIGNGTIPTATTNDYLYYGDQIYKMVLYVEES